MYPELFQIPFTPLTVKSYGLMMVIGFMSAVYLIRKLSRNITPDPQLITNAALYSLIAGVLGARLFYVVHHFDQFKGSLLSVFAVWQGGLELLGGVILAVAVITIYIRFHKLPVRRYLDILAVALFLALALGRIGCFLNGCCYGKPSNLPWTVRFPYGSPAYQSQVFANPKRDRPTPQLRLPQEFFFSYIAKDGTMYSDLKPYDDLTGLQQHQVDSGPYRCLSVHPVQLYSSAAALAVCLLLFMFWKRSVKTDKTSSRPGNVFGLMFVFYGICRFLLEFVRDDNPFEIGILTISQIIAIAMVISGLILVAVFRKIKPDNIELSGKMPIR